jgi:hypothetical protein
MMFDVHGIPLSRSHLADRKREIGRQLLKLAGIIVVQEKVDAAHRRELLQLFDALATHVREVATYDRQHPRPRLIQRRPHPETPR